MLWCEAIRFGPRQEQIHERISSMLLKGSEHGKNPFTAAKPSNASRASASIVSVSRTSQPVLLGERDQNTARNNGHDVTHLFQSNSFRVCGLASPTSGRCGGES